MENNVATFCRCCFKAHIFGVRFYHIFLFPRHGHIFQQKLMHSFSLTHKLLKFYVDEVASIFVHSGLHEKRISWGDEFTSPPSRKQLFQSSKASINRVNGNSSFAEIGQFCKNQPISDHIDAPPIKIIPWL